MALYFVKYFSFFSNCLSTCSFSCRHSSPCKKLWFKSRCKKSKKEIKSFKSLCGEFAKVSDPSAVELWTRFVPAAMHVQVWKVRALLSGSRTGPAR